MPLPGKQQYTVIDYYNMPESQRMELIDGQFYPATFAVRLFKEKDTIVEPDISVICDPNMLTDKGCTGAPDWIIEIVSPSTQSHDYIRKLNLYETAGVREYWIINPIKQSIYVYFFEQSSFDTSAYTFADHIQVNIYDDLCIDFHEIRLYIVFWG